MNDRKPAVISALLVALGACLVLWVSGCSSDKPDPEAHSSVSTTADPALIAEIRQSLDATMSLATFMGPFELSFATVMGPPGCQ